MATFCTTTQAENKAGAGASTAGKGNADEYIQQAEATINALCRYDFTSNFDNLDSNSKKINISMDYPTSGASLGSILSVYDLQNKDYYFVDEMTGVGSAETVKYSNDPNYISYIYKSLEPHYYLEIFNTETKQKIKLINYLPDKYVNRNENSESVWYKGFPSFKNVEWSKNTLELYFEFYIREEYDDKIEEKIGSFVFDIKKNELRKLD